MELPETNSFLYFAPFATPRGAKSRVALRQHLPGAVTSDRGRLAIFSALALVLLLASLDQTFKVEIDYAGAALLALALTSIVMIMSLGGALMREATYLSSPTNCGCWRALGNARTGRRRRNCADAW